MNWLQTLFASFLKRQQFLGVAIDNRPEHEKLQDIQHEEVAGATIVTWSEKPADNWKFITPLRDQDGSSGCVAFSNATGTQADNKSVPLSAHDIYTLRSTHGPGMIPMEGLQIVAKAGVCHEDTFLSDGLDEEALNDSPITDFTKEAEEVMGGLAVNLPIDIDTIASVLDRGFHPRICLQFSQMEWNHKPQLILKGSIRHCVTVVDRTIFNGEKCLIIQDSWLTSTAMPNGLRIISESFLNNRCFFAGYILKQPPVSPHPAPQHIFTVDLEFGMKSNEVKLLQQKLSALGFFTVEPTGNFLSLTKQAVRDFQRKYGIPTTGLFGPISRAQLNKL